MLVADVTLVDEDDNPAQDEKGNPVTIGARKSLLRVLGHPVFGSVPGMKAANLLKRKLKKAVEGVPFSVPADDCKRLVEVLNDPDHLGGAGQQEIRGVNTLANLIGVTPRALPQLEDIFVAFTEAPDKEPKPAEPAPVTPVA